MSQEKFFLGRQPILDREQQIIGFELLFRSAESLLRANISDSFQASASVIVNALADFGTREVLGRHKGYFNVNLEMLMSDALELLPKGQVVIELLENIEVNAEVVGRCRDLKRLGFALALDDHVYNAVSDPMSVRLEHMTTGIGCWLMILCRKEMPSMRGISTSRVMTSGTATLIRSAAMKGSAAVAITSICGSDERISAMV